MSMSELLTTSQVASRLGLSRQAVARMVEAGDIAPTARIAVARHGSFVFSVDEVERVSHIQADKVRAQAAELRAEADRLEAKVAAK